MIKEITSRQIIDSGGWTENCDSMVGSEYENEKNFKNFLYVLLDIDQQFSILVLKVTINVRICSFRSECENIKTEVH